MPVFYAVPEDNRNAVFIFPLVPYIEISPDSLDYFTLCTVDDEIFKDFTILR